MTPHFSLFGIPVRVHGSFWMTALLLGYFSYRDIPWALLAWVPVVFVAVLVHEMGHALTVRRFGLPTEVHLVAMGGVTRYPGGRLSQWRHILVSFAGPAVGLVIGGATRAFMVFGPHVSEPVFLVLQMVYFTNFWWAIFNLVPIQPLDGGNIVAAALDRYFGARGQRWARLISVIVACALIALGIAFRQVFMVVMIAMLAMENYRAWQMQSQWADGLKNQGQQRAPQRRDTTVPIDADARVAWSALEQGDAKTVRRVAESLVSRARTDDERYEVAHLLAWGKLLTGDPEAAAQALRLLPRGKLPDALLEGAVLLETGRPANAVKPLAEAIVDRNDDFVATRLARAVASSARFEPVLALLADREKAAAVGARALQLVVNESFYAGHHEAAAKMGELVFERFSQANDAFNVACSLGKLGREVEAIAWLERAIDAGLSDPSVLDTDTDIAPLRARPEFRGVRSRAGLA